MSAVIPAQVLVVEDDPHLAAGVMENLRAEGYEVSLAGDGEQALTWLGAHGCALVILDVMLPGADGLTVCRSRSVRQTLSPSAPGSITSRTMSAQSCPDSQVSACSPSEATLTS